MSNGNQNASGSQSVGKNCSSGRETCTSAGRPFTMADLNYCPINAEFLRYNNAGSLYNTEGPNQCYNPKMQYTNEGQSFEQDIDSTASNSDSSILPVARGRPVNLEHEIARNHKNALGRLQTESAAACAVRYPLFIQRSQLVGKNAAKCKRRTRPAYRGQDIDLRHELQRHQSKSNTCLPQNRRNVLAGRTLDIDRVYDYNMQANTPPGASGRPFDLERDIPFSCLNLPTSKRQRAKSCPRHMQYATPVSQAPGQAQVCPATTFPSPSPSQNASRSTSPQHYSVAQSPANNSGMSARYPLIPVGPTQRTPSAPRNVTKTVTTTTITTMTVPPISPAKTPLTRSPQRSPNSPVRSPERLQRQDEPATPSIGQDISRHIDEAYEQMAPRGLAAQSLYNTPRSFNYTTQSISPSFRREENSSISYVPQSPLGNFTNATRQYESINIPSPPRHNAQAHETSVTTPLTNAVAPAKTPLTRSPQRSPDRSAGRSPERSQRQDDPTIPSMAQDISRYMDEAYGQTVRRGLAPQSFYDTPRFFNNTTQSISPSYRREENSSISYEPQSQLGNFTATPQYESINIQTPPRPNAQAHETSVTTPLTSTISPIEQTRHSQATAGPNRSYNPNRNNLDSLPGMEISYDDQTPSRACTNSILPSFNESPGPDSYHTLPRRDCPMQQITRCGNETMDISGRDVTLPRRDCPVQQVTQYRNETMDISGRNVCLPAIPGPTDSSRMRALQIPQHDITCCDQNGAHVTMAQSSSGKNHLLEALCGANNTTKTPSSTGECATAKRCGRVQFDSSDKSRVQDLNASTLRGIQIQNLVEDTYCPGLIQDTIDGVENFHNRSFNITMGSRESNATKCEGAPQEEPMTLLEAFSIRIEIERSRMNKDLTDGTPQEQIEEAINKYFANHHPSDLNRSIKCLLLCESIQELEQVVQAKEKPFQADVKKLCTGFQNISKPKLIVYTGNTKPLEDEPSV